VELLSAGEPLGGRRLSELLAAMLEICPRAQEVSPFFCYLFLQRLPREIRVLLADKEPANMQAVAEKVDRYMALHKPQAHECTPLAEEAEDAVAAVSAGRRRHQKKKKGGKQPAEKKQDKGGLCFFHACFGERVYRCEEPCNWVENE
jgi:hypothetical protein